MSEPSAPATASASPSVAEINLEGLLGAAFRWGFERRVNRQPWEQHEEYRKRKAIVWSQIEGVIEERDQALAEVRRMAGDVRLLVEWIGKASDDRAWGLPEERPSDEAIDAYRRLLVAAAPIAAPPAAATEGEGETR